MAQAASFPFSADVATLERYCKLPLHSGVGHVMSHGDATHPLAEAYRQFREAMGKTQSDPVQQEFAASFLVPATGNCLLFLRWPLACPFSRNFGEGLTVSGDSPDGGPFHLECPVYYFRLTSGAGEKPGWAVASPCNQPAILTYGSARPIAKVTATINNFDFEYGNLAESETELDQGEVLRVEASGRTIDFAWRKERVHLRRLVDARIIPSTSLVTFSFAAWPAASDEQLAKFAHHVASLCYYVVGQHAGVPVLSFFDAAGQVVRRTLREAIQSKFRPCCALPSLHSGLPQLFRQCFEEHVRMQGSDLWRRLPFLYAAIEDPPYLEQKYATLMMAVELLIRSTLIENGNLTLDQAKSKTLPQLIAMARGTLRWDVPRHYTEKERYRLIRNAADHGGSLPHDIPQVRNDYDKWRLFLLRRILMRLGYDGEVESPQSGFASSSRVDEFSEEHNSFRP